MTAALSITSHDRDAAGLKYVYPVISRRAGGLSVGINFNVTNACNWRCIYCQVPDLSKGAAPEVDLPLLEQELELFLNSILHGDFFDRVEVKPDHRVIKDIAISGNGEPTSAKNFPSAVKLIGKIGQKLGVFPASRFVLITNGSLIHQEWVKEGLEIFNTFGGEVWFKLDSATKVGRQRVNNTAQSTENALNNLKLAAQLCAVKLQTCVFDYEGQGLTESEQFAYLDALRWVKAETPVKEVMLYTLARPSFQPEAALLKPLPVQGMEEFAAKLRNLGFTVSVSG